MNSPARAFVLSVRNPLRARCSRLLRHRFAALLLLLTFHFSLLTPRASAAVPFLLNYQGRVTVTTGSPPVTVAFSGFGQFRFALVDAAGTTTYWSNDGTSVGGSQPTNGVLLSVPASANGTASLLLGDTGMTAIPAAVFTTHADVRLRVWFDDGNNGVQRLDPDQRVAAAGYAAVAGTVPDGAITGAKIAAGTITNSNILAGTITGDRVATGVNGLTGANIRNGEIGSTQLANGAVGPTQLANGAAAASLLTAGQSGVPNGGIILSREPNSAALAAAGYVRIGAMNPTPDRWTNLKPNAIPVGRYFFPAVWTGSEMIVWGGYISPTDIYLNDGARYNPATDTWTALSAIYAPTPRLLHSALWTGTEMIIWGGYSYGSDLNDGARYSPASDSWTTLPNSSLSGRDSHTAIWTGGEMIIWGGKNASSVGFGDGARFNPGNNTWTPMNPSGLAGRGDHSAVWTGDEMIIWGGGISQGAYFNDGARYRPATNTWTDLAISPLGPRAFQSTVWTGTEMIVWGGRIFVNPNFDQYGDGAKYDPEHDTWSVLTSTLAPVARDYHTAVWSGSEMIIWGGYTRLDAGDRADGARYNPTGGGTWTALPSSGAPSARNDHVSVWTGTEMLIWGGYSNSLGRPRSDGGRYSPITNAWSPLGLGGAPSPRYYHTMVWSGAEAIVWGGTSTGGAKFNPATNQWTATNDTNAPPHRHLHSAIWTGTHMIIWGGEDSVNTGGKYDPLANDWLPMLPSTGVLAGRFYHTAVWTGTDMIVWGGQDYNGFFGDGAKYNPGNNSWTLITNPGLAARVLHTAVWTGQEMIVWGGTTGVGSPLSDGGRFIPGPVESPGNWLPLAATSTIGRYAATTVWTGREMVVWGGYGVGGYITSGGRYSTASQTWIPMSSPSIDGRSNHGAVWTGNEMIVWGGTQYQNNSYVDYNDGGRYDPVNDSWTTMTSVGAPSTRWGAGVAWTGTQFLVFGGVHNYPTVADNQIFGYTPPIQLYLYSRP